ncbi:heme-binding protein 1-like isoform X2 [Portunus trituberculatus]|nr:heme-binding protein 1-like isoform X2 [Portunus trituberculatus]
MMCTKMVMVVMVVAILQPPLTNAANIFTAFSRGFERQEEIQTTVLNQGSGWESREVPGKVWACTGQEGSNGQITTSKQMAAFLRLFSYLDGKNSLGQKLPMGKPVSIEVKTAADGSREVNACFFLPERIQADPPTPTDPLVFLSQRPTLTIFTTRFGGFATDEDKWMREARELKRVLTAEGIETREDLQYWNAYDPPYKFWRRRNEVWLVKPEEQV